MFTVSQCHICSSGGFCSVSRGGSVVIFAADIQSYDRCLLVRVVFYEMFLCHWLWYKMWKLFFVELDGSVLVVVVCLKKNKKKSGAKHYLLSRAGYHLKCVSTIANMHCADNKTIHFLKPFFFFFLQNKKCFIAQAIPDLMKETCIGPRIWCPFSILESGWAI